MAAISGCSGSDGGVDRVRSGPSSSLPRGANNGGLIPGGAAGLGGSLNPNALSGSGASNTPQNSAELDEDTCAAARISAARVTPIVYLVIDGSGSMNAPFGGGTRWSVLREALIGSSGVVTQLESVVKFGSAIYSNTDPMSCPGMSQVMPNLSNLQSIQAAYPATEPGGGTPTGEALQKVVDSLPDFTMQGPDTGVQIAPIIMLATDGEPNGCGEGVICDWTDWANCLGMLLGTLANAPATYETTLKAVRTAKAKGIPVWVVSLANGLNAIPELQRTANIGAGLEETASPGAMIYSPQNPAELTGTLTQLIGGAVSCAVELKGSLDVNRACEGTVQMNGEMLECNGAEGWKPVDESHIELMGKSCARFKSDPTVLLDARFPCDVVRPL